MDKTKVELSYEDMKRLRQALYALRRETAHHLRFAHKTYDEEFKRTINDELERIRELEIRLLESEEGHK